MHALVMYICKACSHIPGVTINPKVIKRIYEYLYTLDTQIYFISTFNVYLISKVIIFWLVDIFLC